MPLEAFFMPARGGGQRFCLFHPAYGQERGVVVYVHPFAEEMNKSRRMAALQSRALSGAGYSVLQMDLLGCGDSNGDFGDATWDAWVDDVLLGCQWVRRRSRAPLWLWGLRGGCLLASQAAGQLGDPCNLLFWQPAASGKALLHQFLRLKLAGDALRRDARPTGGSLREQLETDTAIEVSGYRLSPALATGLEQAKLQASANVGRLECLDVTGPAGSSVAGARQAALSPWRAAGCRVRSHVVEGPSFWQTTEVEEAPALLRHTLLALEEAASA